MPSIGFSLAHHAAAATTDAHSLRAECKIAAPDACRGGGIGPTKARRPAKDALRRPVVDIHASVGIRCSAPPSSPTEEGERGAHE